MRLKCPALACCLLLSVPVIASANGGPMGGHTGFAAGRSFAPGPAWSGRPGWQRGAVHVNRFSWRTGRWWRGIRGRRFGWWWVVGPSWYWYPFATYPYPDFYTPAELAPGYWYWCNFYLNYYPNVSDCPTGWLPYSPQ